MLKQSVVEGVLRTYKTPCYIYDLDEVDTRLNELSSWLPSNSKLFYSLKANPLPGIVSHILKKNLSLEVTSIGELNTAINLTAAQNILFTGPGKTELEINYALEKNVYFFSCESFVELERLNMIAKKNNKTVNVLLRINPKKSMMFNLSMCGKPSQFGFDLDAIKKLNASLYNAISICGIHIYYGTQITSFEALNASFNEVLLVADELKKELDIPLDYIDFGGGFPWPYASQGEMRINKQLKCPESINGSCYMFESGRYIVASSGNLLTTVVDLKESYGKLYIILDAGINTLGGMSGLGRLHRSDMDFINLTAHRNTIRNYHFVGALCTPLDSMAYDKECSEVKIGDVLMVPNVGAYGATASLTHFLSKVPATEITYNQCGIMNAYQLEEGYKCL